MTDRDTRWVEWQRAHSEALAALQDRQREYHRLVAESAFATSSDDRPRQMTRQRQSLEALDEARVCLDRVRVSRPTI